MAYVDVTTSQFSFNPETQDFVTEASELSWKPGYWPSHVKLTNTKTGGARYLEIVKDPEIEGYVNYKDVDGGPLKLKIFND